jgi:arylformamidase
MKKIYDISQVLKPSLPVWPGDTGFELTPNWILEDDCPVNVSRLTLSTHSGSHADAPLHYSAKGGDAAAMDLSRYLGPCLVVDASHAKGVIKPADIEADLPQTLKRIIFKTYDIFPADKWDSDFTAIHPDTIDLLASKGCVLVGLDSPSLDPETSKSISSHQRVLNHGMSVLEGLVLDGVPEGVYELIALPLKIEGGDASPVRAVLREF